MNTSRLPRNNFPSCKEYFLVTDEGEVPFDSEVVQQQPPPPPLDWEAFVATATTTQENISINQALWESIRNSNHSQLEIQILPLTTTINNCLQQWKKSNRF